MVGGIGAAGVVGSSLAGDLVVAIAFGPAYAAAAPLLVPYAAATGLFALARETAQRHPQGRAVHPEADRKVALWR